MNKHLLEKGLKFIETKDEVECYGSISIPVGSKLFILKTDKIQLISPVFHIDKEKITDKFTYTNTKALLTCNNKIEYNCLVKHNDIYYTLERTYRYTINGVYHYELKQAPLSNILIFDSYKDIPEDVLYDYTSIPYIINLFLNKYSIHTYPHNLLVNDELLKDKCIFIQLLDTYTYSMSKDSVKEDYIRLYLNNYSRKELYELLNKIELMININELNVINKSNIFNVKQLNDNSLVSNISGYIEFNISYMIEENVLDIKKYIESIMITINKHRQIKSKLK